MFKLIVGCLQPGRHDLSVAVINRTKSSITRLTEHAKVPLTLAISPRRDANARWFSSTPVACLQEVHETKIGNVTTVEAVEVKDPDEGLLMLLNENCAEKCPLCGIVEDIRYDDVLILGQFMRPNGTLLPRNITGLCGNAQKRMTQVVYQAGKAGMFRGAFKYRIAQKMKWPKAGGYKHPRYYNDQSEFKYSPFTYDWVKKPKYPQK